MKSIFRTVTTDLKANNISHVLFGGAILGYLRNRRFVPYDNDLDVWMDGKYWNTSLFAKIRRKWSSVDGINTMYFWGGGMLWVYYDKNIGNGVDIWPWYVRGPKLRMAKDYDHHYDVPKELIFPLVSTDFSGIQTYVPGNPEGYCEWQYGTNWRQEKNCTKVERRKCIV